MCSNGEPGCEYRLDCYRARSSGCNRLGEGALNSKESARRESSSAGVAVQSLGGDTILVLEDANTIIDVPFYIVNELVYTQVNLGCW